MNLAEMKNSVMFQSNNDIDDLEDFLPYLNDYINEGYDRLVFAFAKHHVGPDEEIYTPLTNDKSTPELPDWTHRAIADYATWLVYRNGSAQKQARGREFLNRFLEIENRLQGMSAAEKGLVDENGDSTLPVYGKFFRNLPW